jgi:hypothetical protein
MNSIVARIRTKTEARPPPQLRSPPSPTLVRGGASLFFRVLTQPPLFILSPLTILTNTLSVHNLLDIRYPLFSCFEFSKGQLPNLRFKYRAHSKRRSSAKIRFESREYSSKHDATNTFNLVSLQRCILDLQRSF